MPMNISLTPRLEEMIRENDRLTVPIALPARLSAKL